VDSGHCTRGDLLYGQKRYSLAAQEFQKALTDDPDDAYAYSRLGVCYLALKDTKSAYQEVKTALALAPDSPYPHYVFAFILTSDGKDKEAEAELKVAIGIEPWHAAYFSLLAGIHIKQQRWKEALAASEQGLSFEPHHLDCGIFRSRVLMRLGRKSEAMSVAQSSLSHAPDEADNHSTMGWTLLDAGDYLGAEEHFRESLRLDPSDEWAKSGILRALKARNPFYRVFLAYLNWAARRSRNERIAFVASLYFGRLGLQAVGANYPRLWPLCFVGILLYFLFWFSTWMADPLANLALRFNKFGKYLLSPRQIIAANILTGTLTFTAAAFGVWCFRHRGGWLVLAVSGLAIGYFVSKAFTKKGVGDQTLYGFLAALTAIIALLAATTLGL